VETQGPIADQVNTIVARVTGERHYAALGLSMNYDSRNNHFTPTQGINAVLKYDNYSAALGSAREFTELQLNVHAFRTISDT
jgi:outer membrane protein assembly factor BamA